MSNENKTRKYLAAVQQQLSLYETMLDAATQHIDREYARQQEAGVTTYIGREDFHVTQIAKAIEEFKAERDTLAKELGI